MIMGIGTVRAVHVTNILHVAEGLFTLYRATIQAIFWSRAPTLYQWNFRKACVLGEDYSPGQLFR
jgi:hypothetical protein